MRLTRFKQALTIEVQAADYPQTVPTVYITGLEVTCMCPLDSSPMSFRSREGWKMTVCLCQGNQCCMGQYNGAVSYNSISGMFTITNEK